MRRFGNKVYYGDASRLDLLRAAGAATARVLVLAIDDAEASVRTATLVREQFPQLKIFARARNRQHAFALMDAGVRNVIRETYVSSLEMASSVLEALGESPAAGARGGAALPHPRRGHARRRSTRSRKTRSKFLATSREAAQQLEKLFESDRDALGVAVDEARSVRDFWFGTLPLSAAALNRRMRFWFGDEPSEVRQRRDEQHPGALRHAARARRRAVSWTPGRTGRAGA